MWGYLSQFLISITLVITHFVRFISTTVPINGINPNKWGKTLAPWFSEDCREAKKNLCKIRRLYPKGHELIVTAASEFRAACVIGRRMFANAIPDLLKYSPK